MCLLSWQRREEKTIQEAPHHPAAVQRRTGVFGGAGGGAGLRGPENLPRIQVSLLLHPQNVVWLKPCCSVRELSLLSGLRLIYASFMQENRLTHFIGFKCECPNTPKASFMLGRVLKQAYTYTHFLFNPYPAVCSPICIAFPQKVVHVLLCYVLLLVLALWATLLNTAPSQFLVVLLLLV